MAGVAVALALDRRPVTLLLAELFDLLVDQRLRDLRLAPGQGKAIQLVQREFRTQFAVQFELERLARLGLEVVHMRLRRELQIFTVDGFLEGFVDDQLDGFLPNGFREFLAHHRRRRLAGAETGEGDLRGVFFGGLVFVRCDGFRRHRNLQSTRDTGLLSRSNRDIHH